MATLLSRLLLRSTRSPRARPPNLLLPPVPIYHRPSLSRRFARVSTQARIQNLRSQITSPQQQVLRAEELLQYLGADRSISPIFKPSHPLVKHWISILANSETSSNSKDYALTELGRILMYEAMRSSSVTAYWKNFAAKDVVAVITLPGSRLLAKHAYEILPPSEIYDTGLIGDEETLPITTYLINKLPTISEETKVFLVDLFFSTDGAAMEVLSLLRDRGVQNTNINVICISVSAATIQKLSEEFPGICVYAGLFTLPTVDDDDGYLLSLLLRRFQN